jgi:diguanylate cyclase (GGDEF)-like protein
MSRRLLTLAALAAVYFVAAKFGLAFAFVNASATAVWPPTGIALAAILVLGYEVWPAILVGAFLANLTTQGSVATSIGIGLGNTLEALTGAYLVNRFANGRRFFARTQDIFAFAGLAAIVSTAVSATLGVTSLAFTGFARWPDFGPIWLTWWLGDAAGDLIVTPALILWIAAPRLRWSGRWPWEAGALVLGLSLVALVVFGEFLPAVAAQHLPLEFLIIPFLFWAAFRLGRRAVASCVFALSWISVWGTLHGFGPFARESQNQSLLLLQTYLAVEAVTMLAVAAVVWERRQGELQLRQQAVTDPLTGLANYRQLISVLAGEIKRSRRTDRSFAVLLLDLDGLKQVNDRHGHLVGNRALCRLADALRAAGRTTDCPARFGGDEFGVVLPETSETGARQAASRVAERLALDQETPQLSASIGIALYPRDGATVEQLLSAADRDLYAAKVARGDRAPHS